MNGVPWSLAAAGLMTPAAPLWRMAPNANLAGATMNVLAPLTWQLAPFAQPA